MDLLCLGTDESAVVRLAEQGWTWKFPGGGEVGVKKANA